MCHVARLVLFIMWPTSELNVLVSIRRNSAFTTIGNIILLGKNRVVRIVFVETP